MDAPSVARRGCGDGAGAGSAVPYGTGGLARVGPGAAVGLFVCSSLDSGDGPALAMIITVPDRSVGVAAVQAVRAVGITGAVAGAVSTSVGLGWRPPVAAASSGPPQCPRSLWPSPPGR